MTARVSPFPSLRREAQTDPTAAALTAEAKERAVAEVDEILDVLAMAETLIARLDSSATHPGILSHLHQARRAIETTQLGVAAIRGRAT